MSWSFLPVKIKKNSVELIFLVAQAPETTMLKLINSPYFAIHFKQCQLWEFCVTSKQCYEYREGDQGPVSRKACKAIAKSRTLRLPWELFYSRILNMNRGSLHTRSFRRTHFFVFRYRWNKNDFTCQKSFGAFKKLAQGLDVGRGYLINHFSYLEGMGERG